jgi:FAD/FMN-containing dehydrogenase
LAPAVVAPEVLAVERRVKQQFDPAGRLNPGVVPGGAR